VEEKQKSKLFEEEKILLQQEIIDAQKQLIATLKKDNKSILYRNILLIGRTGNGKSTSANVLTNTNKFKEDSGSVSVTRETQLEEFEENGIKYRVIDTIGVGDTKLSEEQVLDKIAEVAYVAKEGINRILFVIGGRFTNEEADTYDKLVKEFKLDENIGNYITIVRTKYPKFNDKLACEKDRVSLRDENLKLKKILSSAKIIYVDNDPKSDDLRDQSRVKLLKHLEKNSQRSYKPLGLEELIEKITKPIEKKGQLKKTIDNLSKSVKTVDEKEIKGIKKEIENQEEIIREQTQQYLEKKGID
jgi:GTP-binding protein EngB required for normal cell division